MKSLLVVISLVALASTASAQERLQSRVRPVSAAHLQAAKAQYGERKDTAGAIQRVSALAEQEPGYYAAHYNLGLMLANEGRYDEAIASLTRAREIREREGLKDATIYTNLGWAYMLKGESRNAEAAFLLAKENEGLLSDESKATLHNNMGLLYMSTGKLEASRKELKTATQVYGSDAARANLQLLERVEGQNREQLRWKQAAAKAQAKP